MAFFGKKLDKESSSAEATEDKEKKVSDGVVSSDNISLNLPMVLIQPRISEKSGKLAGLNKYVFMVKKQANKVEVKKAVESKYGVRVTQVNMVNTKGKPRNFGRTAGRTGDFRKAIVSLKQGDSIKGLTEVA